MSNRLSSALETAFYDLRLAVRGLVKTPLFTLTTILTLALGIGATTAVFSAVDRILFRSLPYKDADRLVSWGFTGPVDDNEFMLGSSYVKAHKRFAPFVSVTSISPTLESQRGVLGDRHPMQVRSLAVEANLLETLGLAPALGRDFTRQDDLPNTPRVALISHGLWQSRFGGSKAALQQTVILDDQPTQIIGVLPKNFEFPTLGRADILIPQQLNETAQLRGSTRFLRTFARLKDGVSIEQAKKELQPFLQDTIRNDVPPPLRKEVHLTVRSLRDRQVSNVRLASWLLFGAVVALLLIGCGNVANLLLARAVVRERESAMLAALGAGRVRLICQSVIESLVLAFGGALAGCVFTWMLLRLVTNLAPEGTLLLSRAHVDARVLLFTLGVSVLAALGFGVIPALERPRPEALTGWHSTGTRRTLLRNLLVAVQIAISLVLLTGAGLFVRSLWKLERQPIGLEPARTVTASFELIYRRYSTPEKLTNFYNQLETKLAQIPGVSAMALSDSIPPGGWIHSRPFSNIRILGQPPLPSEGGMVLFRYVTPDYFRLLRIPVLQGRVFNENDRTPSQNSIVLSARLARRMFGEESPIGQRIVLNPQEPPLTVVGVVANVKNSGSSNPDEPEYYRARKHSPDMGPGTRAVLLLQSSGPVAAVAPWIRAQIASIDPGLPVTIETMEERLHEQNNRPRFVTVLVGLFAVFGLLLAAIGLYGVMAFLVGRKTREIGVRMALGATPGNVAALVLKNAATWTGLGIAVGLACSLALTRATRSLLFGISPHDPLAMVLAVSALISAALAACLWPCYRAARVDPAVSLRHE